MNRSLIGLSLVLAFFSFFEAPANFDTSKTPTYYRDVLPVIQERCQACHRSGGIAPMAFESYEQVRPFAAAIQSTTEKQIQAPCRAHPTR